MTTKLKIDLAEGILEVEGSEAFVRNIYNDFKAHFIGEEAVTEQPRRRSRRTRRKKTKTSSKTPSKKKTAEPSPKPPEPPEPPPSETPEPSAPKPTYRFLQELDLNATNDHPSLVEFMDTKVPITNEERNLVFLYYLEYIQKLTQISIDHIYTCYRAAKIRAPLNLESSLEATAKQHRWIKFTQPDNLGVTPAGKLYVERQLPKKLKG